MGRCAAIALLVLLLGVEGDDLESLPTAGEGNELTELCDGVVLNVDSDLGNELCVEQKVQHLSSGLGSLVPYLTPGVLRVKVENAPQALMQRFKMYFDTFGFLCLTSIAAVLEDEDVQVSVQTNDVSSAGHTHTEVIIEVEPSRVLRLFQRTSGVAHLWHQPTAAAAVAVAALATVVSLALVARRRLHSEDQEMLLSE